MRELIVGPPGSIVTLSVKRKMHDKDDHDKEQNFDLELTRAEIKHQERCALYSACSAAKWL